MTNSNSNKTILVMNQGTNQVQMVVAIILDPCSLDIEKLLSGIVPEIAKGQISGSLLVVGDSTLVLRNTNNQVLVDEVDTQELLDLADIDEPWRMENLVPMMQQWIRVLATQWRDRIIGPLRDLLVPYIVAGLSGEQIVSDGVWGMDAHRVASPI